MTIPYLTTCNKFKSVLQVEWHKSAAKVKGPHLYYKHVVDLINIGTG